MMHAETMTLKSIVVGEGEKVSQESRYTDRKKYRSMRKEESQPVYIDMSYLISETWGSVIPS